MENGAVGVSTPPPATPAGGSLGFSVDVVTVATLPARPKRELRAGGVLRSSYPRLRHVLGAAGAMLATTAKGTHRNEIPPHSSRHSLGRRRRRRRGRRRGRVRRPLPRPHEHGRPPGHRP